MRLFLALELPKSGLDRLQQLQGTLKKHGRGRFTPRQNLHLTMVFLGEADPDAVLQALRHISAPRQSLQLTGLGTFGSLVYAAVRPTAALTQLQADLTQALLQAGFQPEARKFIPHITLCRNYLGKPPTVPGGPLLTGARLVLMASQLQPDGAIYTPVHKF